MKKESQNVSRSYDLVLQIFAVSNFFITIILCCMMLSYFSDDGSDQVTVFKCEGSYE